MTQADILRWRRFGDAGVLLEFDDGIEATRWCRAVEASNIDAQARPGWRSALITSTMSTASLIEALRSLVLDDAPTAPVRHLNIEVVYDGEDLDDVAASTGMSREAVVARHTGALYTVVCLGFSRAFPYLAGLDRSLWLPRRSTPRVRVPAGSVAIAAEQTGIYPQASPGGWHLLGRTDAVLFDERCEPPSLLQPGDQVRFMTVRA
ncbi:unannotated protein [freshwater metagenome]|uniref:Unannotated protein n=1 Tax=freshwater metagenome TaxID=449393 RepID=A0A6J7EDP7_9ZZZZ|nr:5-oxoprolinase subunit PxpB [Actinomycetota bacterium]